MWPPEHYSSTLRPLATSCVRTCDGSFPSSDLSHVTETAPPPRTANAAPGHEITQTIGGSKREGTLGLRHETGSCRSVKGPLTPLVCILLHSRRFSRRCRPSRPECPIAMKACPCPTPRQRLSHSSDLSDLPDPTRPGPRAPLQNKGMALPSSACKDRRRIVHLNSPLLCGLPVLLLSLPVRAGPCQSVLSKVSSPLPRTRRACSCEAAQSGRNNKESTTQKGTIRIPSLAAMGLSFRKVRGGSATDAPPDKTTRAAVHSDPARTRIAGNAGASQDVSNPDCQKHV